MAIIMALVIIITATTTCFVTIKIVAYFNKASDIAELIRLKNQLEVNEHFFSSEKRKSVVILVGFRKEFAEDEKKDEEFVRTFIVSRDDGSWLVKREGTLLGLRGFIFQPSDSRNDLPMQW